MDRYELDRLRRSVAMLTPGVHALTREDALDLLRELEALQTRFEDARRELRGVLDRMDSGA